jgi:hypothetical protein
MGIGLAAELASQAALAALHARAGTHTCTTTTTALGDGRRQ